MCLYASRRIFSSMISTWPSPGRIATSPCWRMFRSGRPVRVPIAGANRTCAEESFLLPNPRILGSKVIAWSRCSRWDTMDCYWYGGMVTQPVSIPSSICAAFVIVIVVGRNLDQPPEAGYVLTRAELVSPQSVFLIITFTRGIFGFIKGHAFISCVTFYR